jgi:adenosylcobinamide-GDP ribazoletransferase
MVFFPFVGVLCGVALFLVWTVCRLCHVSGALFAVLAVLSIVLVTGGIHLDGFCDTADALYSRRPQAEKLRILKDPNCGPFAVFSVVLVLLCSAGGYYEIYRQQQTSTLLLLAGGHILSRCLSGISVTAFPCAPTSSLVKTFGAHAGRHVTWMLLGEAVLVGAVLLLFWHWLALMLLGAALLVFGWYAHMQKKQFGGLTGDLAGFFLVLCETTWLLVTALLGGVLL